MATIVTNENWLQVDGARLQKGKWDLSQTSTGVRLSDAGERIDIPYQGTTIDGVPVTDTDALMTFFESQGFKNGGGTGEGVQSISGVQVDNTDPSNPVVEAPTYAQVTGKPATFPPSAHTQAFTTITGVATAAQIPSLPISKITDLSNQLAGKLAATEFSAVPDSVATDAPGLVADFNALLALLRRD